MIPHSRLEERGLHSVVTACPRKVTFCGTNCSLDNPALWPSAARCFRSLTVLVSLSNWTANHQVIDGLQQSCTLAKSQRFKTSERVVADGGSFTVTLSHASKCVTLELEAKLAVWMDGNAGCWLKCYMKTKRTDWWRTGDIAASNRNIKLSFVCVFPSAQKSDAHFI